MSEHTDPVSLRDVPETVGWVAELAIAVIAEAANEELQCTAGSWRGHRFRRPRRTLDWFLSRDDGEMTFAWWARMAGLGRVAIDELRRQLRHEHSRRPLLRRLALASTGMRRPPMEDELKGG